MFVDDIREVFKEKLRCNDIAENETLEIINASFIADDEVIFGTLNKDYVEKELRWYLNQDLNISGLEPNIPAIWKVIASEKGFINSNYGWCIYSSENGGQFYQAIKTLIKDKYSRQATMIYNRPSMHEDSKTDGMKDFMCTYAVQLFIRNDKLDYIVYMRSNDAIFGYKNDRYWHNYVFDEVYGVLANTYPELQKGTLYWNAASLHIYPRHFDLVK